MFVRLKTVRNRGRVYRYLHIVENVGEVRRVRQRVIGSLGRLDRLLESGDLEQVVRHLVEHCSGVRLLRAQAAETLQATSDKVWSRAGLRAAVGRAGLRALLKRWAARQRFGFDLVRKVFAQVLQRLLAPGSDLAGSNRSLRLRMSNVQPPSSPLASRVGWIAGVALPGTLAQDRPALRGFTLVR